MFELMDQFRIERGICTEKLVYYAEKFTHTMALSTSVRLPLIAFLSIIVMEDRVVFTDSEDSLIQGFAQIP